MVSLRQDYQPPVIPPNEEERIEELYSLNILDTSSEKKFDYYTKFISELLDMPYALVTLVDKDRQWFKSAHGLNISETPREVSFCGHAILQDDVFIVPDASKDERFAGNPLVKDDPNIRFYAGAVIRGPSRQNIGTCCVIDSKPRKLTKREEKLLFAFAKIVEQEIQASHELRVLREKLQQTALFDPLSELPNRTLFMDRLNLLVRDAEKGGTKLLLVLIRFDKYDRLEGLLGGSGASKIMGRFRSDLIQESGPNSFVGRWQDDILSLLVPLETEESDSLTIVDNIVREFRSPVTVVGTSQQLITSLGACIYPDEAKDTPELVENAFNALRSNPVHEDVQYSFFTSDLKSKIARKLEIEQGLRQAIQKDELYLVFQPKANIATGEICGSEALLRWTSPSLGNISPGEFIPVAEQFGLTVDLGNWVLRKACEQNQAWGEQGLRPLPISVNVTSRQLRQPDFHENVISILGNAGLPSHLLKLEVTEGSLIEDIESAIKIMNRLKDIGILFSIDDFGTGFSSLGYLVKMPLDELKIDKSFIDNITVHQEAASIVQGLIMLARSIGLKVVAEGIEDKEQLIYLRAYQCDEIQGYLFSPPVKSAEFAEMINQDRRL